MPTYKVGQILFAATRKSPRIVPLQVCEEITKTSLTEGETKTYLVTVGNSKNGVDISSIDGDIFVSTQEAKKALMNRFEKSIDELIQVADRNASEFFGTQIPQSRKSDSFVPVASVPEDSYITLPDGTIAKVNLHIPM